MDIKNVSMVELAEIARKNISDFEYAGCGMFNLHLDEDRRLSFINEGGMIWQIYPFEEEWYLSSYVLNYYKVDKDNYEHDDIKFCSLNDEDRYYLIEDIFNALKIDYDKTEHSPASNVDKTIDVKTLLKELLPMVTKVASFRKYVGDELDDCYLGKLVDNGLEPIYGYEDGGKTDLYYATYTNKNYKEDITITIKFSIDVDCRDKTILCINTDDVDIIINGELYDCISF